MTLKILIDSEPANATRTDAEVLAWLQESVNRNRTSITGDEMFQATATAGWAGLTDAQKSQWLALCARSSIDPFGSANVALVTSLFGAGSATVTALQALRVESVNRVVNAGLSVPFLTESYVHTVRNS